MSIFIDLTGYKIQNIAGARGAVGFIELSKSAFGATYCHKLTVLNIKVPCKTRSCSTDIVDIGFFVAAFCTNETF
jgi:hypothetical protein